MDQSSTEEKYALNDAVCLGSVDDVDQIWQRIGLSLNNVIKVSMTRRSPPIRK